MPLWYQVWLLCGLLNFVIFFIQNFNTDASRVWEEFEGFWKNSYPLNKNNHFTFKHYILFITCSLLAGPLVLISDMYDGARMLMDIFAKLIKEARKNE